jgi:23S rRNA pseudouridine1911/1915/1917 synthase
MFAVSAEWLDNGVMSGVPPKKKHPRKGRSRTARPDRVSARPSARPSAEEDRRRPRFSRELSVLYEDDAVVVLDKPAGLLAVPVEGLDTPSALSLLVAKLKLKKQRVLIVHRIDRFASGALLFAKTGPDRDALVRQFLEHTPARQYLAVVRGRLGVEAGTLVHYFRRQGMFQQLRTARDPQAARAELRYSVERLFADASLVRVELVTGLQNQIRAQFSAMGHPVIGDRKYHREESSEPLIARVALHAAHLEFVHPRSGKSVSIDCKLPLDFQHLVRELSRSRRARK